jgi:hypothetical protein
MKTVKTANVKDHALALQYRRKFTRAHNALTRQYTYQQRRDLYGLHVIFQSRIDEG